MPFVKESLDDVKEPELAPEGEYELTILKAEPGTTKKGEDMIRLVLRVEDVPDVRPVLHWLLGWSSDTDPDQVAMRKLEVKRFCETFNVPEDFEPEDLPGNSGKAMLIQQQNDQDGSMQNRVRFPRLDG